MRVTTGGDSTEGAARLARTAFVAVATVFALIGVATAVWLSRANVADEFIFGPFPLWSAMDPAGFYLPDVILLFEPGPIAHDHHPGLTMTVMSALLAKVVHAVCASLGGQEPYVEFWVRHRIALNGMLAASANAMLLACCHPMFKVLRQFMSRANAYVGCALFLTSVPVLLYVSRFSPEAWMLYFLLWSIHLSLRSLDGDGSLRSSAAMGVCTTLAVLSKWLAFPIIAFNVYAIFTAPTRWRSRWSWLAVYALCAAAVAVPLLNHLDLDRIVPGLSRQMRGAHGFVATFFLPTQKGFLLHHVLVFGLGTCGLVVMLASAPRTRFRFAALLGALLLLMLEIIQRPQWHYFFGFYWLFPAATAYAVALCLTRWTSWRHDTAAVVAGVAVMIVCNAWAYPRLLATYEHYYSFFARRAELARTHPAWMPAPWEFAYPGFEGNREPTHVFPVYGKRLGPTLDLQRAQEDGSDQQLLTW
jgi:hypothetical protein